MKRFIVPAILLFTTLAGSAGASADESAGAGATLYRQKACHTCHGADGSGNTPVGKSLKVRDLRSDEVQSQSDEALAGVIAEGKGKMPGFKSSLSAEQIRQLVVHVRSLKK